MVARRSHQADGGAALPPLIRRRVGVRPAGVARAFVIVIGRGAPSVGVLLDGPILTPPPADLDAHSAMTGGDKRPDDPYVLPPTCLGVHPMHVSTTMSGVGVAKPPKCVRRAHPGEISTRQGGLVHPLHAQYLLFADTCTRCTRRRKPGGANTRCTRRRKTSGAHGGANPARPRGLGPRGGGGSAPRRSRHPCRRSR